MSGHWAGKGFSFATGVVRYNDLVYVVLSDDALNEKKYPHSGFVEWDGGVWGDGGRTTWWTAGVTISKYPKEQLCAVGIYGGVLLLGSGDRHEEQITGPKGELPKLRGPLRGVRTIGDRVYVVGMNRQVYRRENSNLWVSIDKGARPAPECREIVGFEAIDGFSESEIYAVGWEGEIWYFDGSIWVPIDSPTNMVNKSVLWRMAAYASGRKGLLLRGHGSQWEVVNHGNIIDDIWGLAWYGDTLYVSTMNAVYALVRSCMLSTWVKMHRNLLSFELR